MLPNQPKGQRVSPRAAAASSATEAAQGAKQLADKKKFEQRHKTLALEWDLRKQLGWPLDPKAMSRRIGKSPTWAARRLEGHERISDTDVLHFARELQAAPAELCSEWEFKDLTACPGAIALYQHFHRLEISARSAIMEIIAANGHVKHIPGSKLINVGTRLIKIVEYAPMPRRRR